VIESQTELETAYLNRGRLFMTLNEPAKAVKDWINLLTLYPEAIQDLHITELTLLNQQQPQFYHDKIKIALRFTQRLTIHFANAPRPEMAEGYEDLVDPVTYDLMDDPVTIPSSGMTYDRATIAKLFLTPAEDEVVRCPLTRQSLSRAEFAKLATTISIKKRVEIYVASFECAQKPKPVAEINSATASASAAVIPITNTREQVSKAAFINRIRAELAELLRLNKLRTLPKHTIASFK
jgi:hypothetical protein